jgi:hypothetical protein
MGFWIAKGGFAPRDKPSPWMFQYQGSSWWGPRLRARLAEQVEAIRHWRVIEGDYKQAPALEATYFVDPPYQVAGKTYVHSFQAFGELAEVCRNLPGQVIVCEAEGADWLPFRPFHKAGALSSPKDKTDKHSMEVIWTNSLDPGMG